mgnify:CR=1 FL=1
MNSLYIIGFPSLYGGAGAELYHQIKVWGHLGVEMHLIPTQKLSLIHISEPTRRS